MTHSYTESSDPHIQGISQNIPKTEAETLFCCYTSEALSLFSNLVMYSIITRIPSYNRVINLTDSWSFIGVFSFMSKLSWTLFEEISTLTSSSSIGDSWVNRCELSFCSSWTQTSNHNSHNITDISRVNERAPLADLGLFETVSRSYMTQMSWGWIWDVSWSDSSVTHWVATHILSAGRGAHYNTVKGTFRTSAFVFNSLTPHTMSHFKFR